MAIVISGTSNDILVNGVSVATDAEVSSAVASGVASKADTSYVNTQLSNKANTADLKEIGVGQTWQNVTASRTLGVTYTNTTGKPIVLMISFIGSGESNWSYININGMGSIYWTNIYKTGAGGDSIIIPHGSTYEVSSGGGGVYLFYWLELR